MCVSLHTTGSHSLCELRERERGGERERERGGERKRRTITRLHRVSLLLISAIYMFLSFLLPMWSGH